MRNSGSRHQTGSFATFMRPRRNRFGAHVFVVLSSAISSFYLRINAHRAIVCFYAIQICRRRACGISDLFIDAISLPNENKKIKNIFNSSRSIFALCVHVQNAPSTSQNVGISRTISSSLHRPYTHVSQQLWPMTCHRP